MTFFWTVTVLCTIVGSLQFAWAMLGATSAPQQAAGAAMALCWVVIPYVFTRCLEASNIATWQRDMLKGLGKLATDDNLKVGIESLLKQKDTANRAASPDLIPVLNAKPEPLPSTGLPAEIGKCPRCGAGRTRAETTCPDCYSTKPALFG